MTDYTELVKALRFETDYVAVEKTMRDAAAAIEALQRELNLAEIAADDNGRQVEKLQAEVNRLELDNEDYEHEQRWLKGEIEALQAQLPKLGEWQKAKPKGVVTYSDGYAECSHCHETIWLGWGMNFCPHCGMQNKIIDPDDYDGAKMEVQE